MPNWTKEQTEAIETSGTNIIVSAGAGSGKTAVLTERVLYKLKQGIHINELLILTFTRAAAEEMKDRIRKAIQEEPSLSEELELLDSAYITTFDSFSLSVLKKYHYCFNLPKQIAITDSSIIEMKKIEILDTIFDSYYEKENPLFEQMIMQFCMKDDKGLKKSILKIANKIELLPNAKEYVSTYVETHYNDEFIKDCIEDLRSLFKEKQQELEDALLDFSYYVDNDYYEKVNRVIHPLLDATDFTTIPVIDSLPNLPRNSEEEVKDRKESIKKKVEAILQCKDYGSLDEIKANIEATKSTSTIIISILKDYFEELTTYKRENEIYDFQDIALLAIALVKENEEAREELKNQFKEIMIDEYQDTNDMQETFISYIANQNVYMVGDIKQSIYRFRNANPYIFKNKYDRYQENQNGRKIDLVKNFRSRKEVLDNINFIFTKIMDDRLGGAEYAVSHQMHFGNMAYEEKGKTQQEYNMEFLEYEKSDDYSQEEVEIFAIGRDIKKKIEEHYQIFDKELKMLRNATFGDFTVLLDRGTAFDLYKKIFTYLGIPVLINRDEKLNDSMDLYILKNSIDFLLRIANNTLDKTFEYDFISLARSYLYQMHDDEIFMYFLNKSFTEAKLYQDFKEISNIIDTKSPYEIVTMILEKTNFYERITTTEEIETRLIRMTKLLEITQNLSDIGYDIEDFNDYLTTLIEEEHVMKYNANASSVDSVKLMTIHKSKGLEFPICYFSGLTKTFNLEDIKERFTYDTKYGIIVPFFKEGIQDTVLKVLLKNKYIEEEIAEKIRLFYVALTRAKEKMIFVLPKKEEKESRKIDRGLVVDSLRKKYNSFYDIVLSIKKDLSPYIKELDIKTLGLTKEYVFQKENTFSEEHQEPFQVEEISVDVVEKRQNTFSKESQELISVSTWENMKLGTKVHEILEYIDFINPEYDCIEDNFIQKKVKFFLEHPLLASRNQAQIYKEYEFIYQEGEIEYHGIIDLMLSYEDHIDIIDYKLSNIEDEKYISQLKGYQRYIEQLTKKSVHLYLYSIFQEQIKEIH